MGRKEVTKALTEAVSHYFVHKLYAVFFEFGVGRRGERRLDVMCLHTGLEVVGIEVKSCRADYAADKKWMEYLTYTNKLYLALPPDMIDSPFYEKILADIAPHGIGVMTLGPSGYMMVVKPAKRRDVDDLVIGKLLVKMAWRGGLSRRNVSRRKRIFLEEK